jgi:glutamine cyclotransferase
MKQWHKITALSVLAVLLLLSGITWTMWNSKPSPAPSPSPSTSAPPSPTSPSTRYTYSVIYTYPHSQNAFTEGLAYADGDLYESTGNYGASSLRRVDLETGSILQQVSLSSQFFGEGTTIVNDLIIQLTYREHIAFISDKNTLRPLGNFTYSTEGWGLTYDGSRLIMSDGSDKLYFLNATTYETIAQVKVHDGAVSIANLNELEYINGDVYANIWHEQKIAIINPQGGQVKAWIDLTGLQGTAAASSEDVLNGIAYDAANDRLFVTGKNWPTLFEIKLVPQSDLP